MKRPSLDALWYQAISLGTVGLVVTALLAIFKLLTGDAIAAANERDTRASLEEVLPPGFADNNLLQDSVQVALHDGSPRTVYRARKAGAVRAVLFETSGAGYAGPIRIVMAVDRDGAVLGVRVTRHNETPGLGDKIEVARSPWIRSFEGKSLSAPASARWAVKKDGGDFDQFAGATITPRGVVGAVRGGLEFFGAHRAQLIEEGREVVK